MRRAFAFLTVFGGAAPPTPDSLLWFPVVGTVIGLALGAVWWGGDRIWPPLVVAALVVAADLLITGMLHLDGLADSADGLLPHLPAERRLAVMAEPTIGAFGVTVVGTVLLLRFAALGSAVPEPLALAGIWCASRTTMAVTVATMTYARPGGLADSFRDRTRPPTAVPLAIAGCALAGALASISAGALGLAAVIGCVVGAVGVVALGRARLGGFTGDVLGAAGVIGETVGLLVLALNR